MSGDLLWHVWSMLERLPMLVKALEYWIDLCDKLVEVTWLQSNSAMAYWCVVEYTTHELFKSLLGSSWKLRGVDVSITWNENVTYLLNDRLVIFFLTFFNLCFITIMNEIICLNTAVSYNLIIHLPDLRSHHPHTNDNYPLQYYCQHCSMWLSGVVRRGTGERYVPHYGWNPSSWVLSYPLQPVCRCMIAW